MATILHSWKQNLLSAVALFGLAQSEALAQKPAAEAEALKAQQDSVWIARLQPGFTMLKNLDAAYAYGKMAAGMKRMPGNVQRYRATYIKGADTMDVQILKEGAKIKTQIVSLSDKRHRQSQFDDGENYKLAYVQKGDSMTIETETEKWSDVITRTFRVIKGDNRLLGVCKTEGDKKEVCGVSMMVVNPDPATQSTHYALINNKSVAHGPAVIETNHCVDGTYTPSQIIHDKPDAAVNFRNNGVRIFGAENYRKVIEFAKVPQ
ncbi:MAG TPA: hypothetical protein VGF14_01210 [Alphaproteobacteria bacterium]